VVRLDGLEEQRESGKPLWGSALLLAYYPMLSRLRHRLVTTTVTSAGRAGKRRCDV